MQPNFANFCTALGWDITSPEFARVAAIVNQPDTRETYVSIYRRVQRIVEYYAEFTITSKTGKRLRAHVECCRAERADLAAALDAIASATGDVTMDEKSTMSPILGRLRAVNPQGKFGRFIV